MTDPDPYWYRARLNPGARQWDGDTIRIDIDQGFDDWKINQSVRLARIDAPERRGKSKAAAMRARDYLLLIIGDKPFYIKTHQLNGKLRGKYGRFIVDVWVYTNELKCANDLMVEAGHAVYKKY